MIEEIIKKECVKFSTPLTPEGLQLLLYNVAKQSAEYYVEQALKEASEARAISMLGNNWYKYTLNSGTTILADINIELHKDSILESYPLKNIK